MDLLAWRFVLPQILHQMALLVPKTDCSVKIIKLNVTFPHHEPVKKFNETHLVQVCFNTIDDAWQQLTLAEQSNC